MDRVDFHRCKFTSFWYEEIYLNTNKKALLNGNA